MRRFVITLAALMMIGGFATRASAQNPFNINGVVPDAGVVTTQDPQGNVKELGPVNGTATKIGVINTATPPMLEFTNPNAQVDLDAVYLQTQTAVNGDQWLYFGWLRDSNNGSGFISIEFQQAALTPSCVYTTAGIDFVLPQSAAETALINSCNPWRGRQSGDFIILWDQQGNGLAFDDIKKRTFTCTGTTVPYNCTLGPLQDLGTVVAAVSSDRFSGEMAINLTTEVFGGTSSCLTFANVLPGTVTGNSDQADYKDTVFATFPPITNCGILKVSKVTLNPDNSVRADTTSAFGYTVTKSGDALRFNTDAADYPVDGPAPQISIVRPNSNTPAGEAIHGGETQTHLDLKTGSNYTLVEATPLPSPYELVSIICTDSAGAHNITAGGTYAVSVPSGTFEFTSCVITNRFVRASPSGTTVQSATVRLFDSISITGIAAGATDASSATATFRLYSDNTCTTQVGSSSVQSLAYANGGTTATADTLGGTGILVSAGATYYWRVQYTGDALNNGFHTACGVETTGVTITINNNGAPSGGS